MASFFHFFAQRNLLAYLITLIIILLGVSSMLTIKRDSFPDVAFGELLITTAYPGASPEDVELKVTNEIEKEIKEVVGIKRYLSWSMENVSSIHVVIDPDADDEDKVIREIREAVTRVSDLPSEVTESPLVTELGTSSFPMIEVGFAGNIPYKELREHARLFEKKLENLSGVSSVERYGYRAREIRVEVSPKALAKSDLSLIDVVQAIKGRNIRATGGSFESYTSEKNIVTLAQFRKPKEVGDAVVRATFNGPLVRIKDLAIIHDDYEEEKVESRVNGESAISFVAFKSTNADIIRTVDDIKKLVEKEQNVLPEGVKILISNDASTYVRDRFSIVATNGVIGLFFVMIVLSIFLNYRIAFWVALGIPVSIFGVIFLLPLFDSYLDSVTMTAMVLVIGIVVDDAIIISENIYRKYEQGYTPIEAATEGVLSVFKPVVTTVLTTVIVFSPMFFMPGMMGKFVYVIPLVIILALMISMIESSMALPAHLVGGMKKHQRTQKSMGGFFSRLRTKYQRILFAMLKARYFLVLVFISVLAGSVFYAVKYMDFILFPSSSAERFVVLVETPIGTSLKATSDRVSKIEALIADLGPDELDTHVTRIGTFGDIGSSERENNAAVWVNLTPYATRKRTADQIVESLRKQTNELKEFERVRYMIDSGGPPVGRPIMMRVVGTNDALRKKLADDLRTFLETIPGTKDIERDDKEGKQQIEIKLDYKKLARVGITVADVAQNVRIAYDGEVVTSVRYGDEDVDFRVIYSEKVRKSPGYLKNLKLPNRNGYLTPLGQLARFKTVPGPSTIHHYKGDRAITISGDVDKEVTTPLKIKAAVQEKFKSLQKYPGVNIVIGGEAEESEESLNELFIILGIAALGIYFLLILLFNSLWQPILVMMAIPFGMIGVIVGFSIHEEALGFLAMTGIIGLAGVVVNDSLVLVNHINELRTRDSDRLMREIIAEGTADRLRAILLTTISTVAGLFPLAYGLGGADAYMGPMALALAWGLLFATPLTLVLIPSLMMVSHDLSNLFRREKLA